MAFIFNPKEDKPCMITMSPTHLSHTFTVIDNLNEKFTRKGEIWKGSGKLVAAQESSKYPFIYFIIIQENGK